MEQYIWLLLPLIFIFHDMEEIVGFTPWFQKNEKLLAEKYPAILKIYNNSTTEGFALAVYEELILCMLFSFLALFTDFTSFKLFWFGAFVGCTVHFVIHIVQAIIIKKYIPALATSLICLPVSIIILIKSTRLIECKKLAMILFSLLGIILIAVNLKFAHSLMHWFSKKFCKSSVPQNNQ